jgi:hypothetical protein
VRELVSEKAATALRAGAVLASAERDVGADGEGTGVDRAGNAARVDIGVDADPTEVDAESVLKEMPLAGRQRLTTSAQRLDPCPDVVADRARNAFIGGPSDGRGKRQAPHRVILAGSAPAVDCGAYVVSDGRRPKIGRIGGPHSGLGLLLRFLLGRIAGH